MDTKAKVVELAQTIGLLFIISVLISFYWNLIIRGIGAIDWKMTTFLTIILVFSLSIRDLLKQKTREEQKGGNDGEDSGLTSNPTESRM